MVVTINAAIFLTIVYVSFHKSPEQRHSKLEDLLQRKADRTEPKKECKKNPNLFMPCKDHFIGGLKNLKRYEVKSINRSIFQIGSQLGFFAKLENPPALKEHPAPLICNFFSLWGHFRLFGSGLRILGPGILSSSD